MATCNICKYAGTPSYKSPCSECKGFSKYEYEKPQTNADRIRAMSDEELAEDICDVLMCAQCPALCLCNSTDGKANGLKKWLQQPAEGE